MFAPAVVLFFGKKYARYVSYYFGLLFLLFSFFIFYTSNVFGGGKHFDSDVYVFNFHPGLVMYYKVEGAVCNSDGCSVKIKSILSPTEYSLCSLTHREDIDIAEVRSRFSVCEVYLDTSPENYNLTIEYGRDTLSGFLVYTCVVFHFFIFYKPCHKGRLILWKVIKQLFY